MSTQPVRTLTVTFRDDDTTPDRLNDLARETGLTPEELVLRATADSLGVYGLVEPPAEAQPKNLRELFEACGLIKSDSRAQPPRADREDDAS